MTTPTKIIVNCETGETTEVPLTAEEIAQAEADRQAWEALQAEREAEAQAKEQAEASAIAKLQAIGLTAEEIAALRG